MEILSVKDIIKKIVVFLLIFLSFFLNLYIYNQNQEEINHFKPYYTESYLFAAQHRISLINGEKQNVQNIVSNAKSVPVLVYHGVVDSPDGVSINIENFKNQMFELKKEGYKTIRLEEFSQYILGNRQLPDKSIMITFDDGRKDSYYPVDPILKELNYSAVMFVITGTLDSKTNNFHLISSEVEKMIASNRWDIEVHTANGHGLIPIDASGKKGHFYSNKKWLTDQNRVESDQEYTDRIGNDLQSAKNYLNDKFQINPTAFAFPFGDYGLESSNFPNAKELLKEQAVNNYAHLFYQTDEEKGYSFNVSNKDDPMIKRININPDWKSGDLLKVLSKGKEKNLPVRFTSFNQDQGWIKNWGSVNYRDNKLVLSANEEINGASIFLDGTSSWKKYIYTADINTSGSDAVSLLFCYYDDANYKRLVFTDGKISIIGKVNNKDVTFATSEHQQKINNGNISLSISVDSGHVKGLVNNISVIETQIETQPGGIGLLVWNDNNESATISVNSMQIENN